MEDEADGAGGGTAPALPFFSCDTGGEPTAVGGCRAAFAAPARGDARVASRAAAMDGPRVGASTPAGDGPAGIPLTHPPPPAFPPRLHRAHRDGVWSRTVSPPRPRGRDSAPPLSSRHVSEEHVFPQVTGLLCSLSGFLRHASQRSSTSLKETARLRRQLPPLLRSLTVPLFNRRREEGERRTYSTVRYLCCWGEGLAAKAALPWHRRVGAARVTIRPERRSLDFNARNGPQVEQYFSHTVRESHLRDPGPDLRTRHTWRSTFDIILPTNGFLFSLSRDSAWSFYNKKSRAVATGRAVVSVCCRPDQRWSGNSVGERKEGGGWPRYHPLPTAPRAAAGVSPPSLLPPLPRPPLPGRGRRGPDLCADKCGCQCGDAARPAPTGWAG